MCSEETEEREVGDLCTKYFSQRSKEMRYTT